MTALQEERKEKLGDMSDILEKRDSIGKQIQAAMKILEGCLGGLYTDIQACARLECVTGVARIWMTQSLEVFASFRER